MGRKPYCKESTTLARTQPLVVAPATSTVSTPAAVSVAARDVPKKAEAYFLMTSVSCGPAGGPGANAAGALCRRRTCKGGAVLIHQPPARRVGSPAVGG